MTPAATTGGVLDVPGPPLVVFVDEDPGVRIAFTRRTAGGGGNLSLVVGGGDVTAERRAAVAAVTADADRAVFMQQVHGGAVAVVDGRHAGRGRNDHGDAIEGVDGLVTKALDLPLVVLAADCVPVVLVDPGRGVGAVHAGRQGVVKGVVAQALARLDAPDPSRVVALVGPAIGGCCYEVPQAMVDEVGAAWPQAVAATSHGAPALDLPRAVGAQLQAAGVSDVRRVGSCTRCNPDALFSHRAATAGIAAAGRQAAVVVRTSPTAPGAPVPALQTPS